MVIKSHEPPSAGSGGGCYEPSPWLGRAGARGSGHLFFSVPHSGYPRQNLPYNHAPEKGIILRIPALRGPNPLRAFGVIGFWGGFEGLRVFEGLMVFRVLGFFS